MKNYQLVFILLFVSGILFAQTEISSFNATGAGYSTSYVTDYQCLGINPANLGWTRNNHTMNLGFAEFAGSIYSEQLARKQVIKDFFDSNFKLDLDEKELAAENFTDTKLLGIASFMGIGFSYQDEEIGGFAFSVRERFVWYSFLNDYAARFLFMGYNDPYFDSLTVANGDTIGYSTKSKYASNLYEGTDQHFILYSEFNFGYGRKVLKNENLVWYLGLGIKYVIGYGMTQYYQDADGKLVGYSALSPTFNIDYNEPTPSQIGGTGYKKVGSGFGFDIGTTLEIKENLKISVAVNDIGSIKWDGNVYKGNDGRVWEIETAGMDNYNVFEQGGLITTDNHPDDPNLWTGLENVTLRLPMNLRGGASYRFLDVLEAGVDIYVPLDEKAPGAYEKPVFGLGGRYDPAKWLQLSLGLVSGGKFGTNAQLGVIFYPIRTEKITWEVGFASRNIISIFKQKNPTVSLAFGFLRFSFGAKDASTRYLEEE